MAINPTLQLLSRVKRQNLYCDFKSREIATRRVRKKYKLAGNNIKSLGIYIFYIMTTNKLACRQSCTLCVHASEWENLKSGYLSKSYGYIDITKYEAIKAGELIYKLQDKNNGFPFVAKLAYNRYKKLIKLIDKVDYGIGRQISKKDKRYILAGLATDVGDISDELLMKLGL